MKRLILLAITIVVSQFIYAQHVQFGVKGGINISKIHGENKDADSSLKAAIGYHFGILAHLHLNQKWAIQPEVLYSTVGWKTNYTDRTIAYQLDYVNVPVLVQYMTSSGLRIETGPQVGLLVRNKPEIDVYNKTNFSWVFGIGYLSQSGFGVDARYNLGLSDLIKKDLVSSSNAKSRVGQIGIFYQFKH